MTKKPWIIATIVATSCLLLDTHDAEAQGGRHCGHGSSSYGQATQYYSYPASRAVVYSNNTYGARAYYPSVGNSSGYGRYNYPSQIRYSGGYGYRGGNSYRSGFGGYGYQSNGGLSIGIGVGGYGNRGYRGFGY